MNEAVAFNRGLTALAADPEVALPGLGPTSVLGGEWEKVEGRNKDERELFRCVGQLALACCCRSCRCCRGRHSEGRANGIWGCTPPALASKPG